MSTFKRHPGRGSGLDVDRNKELLDAFHEKHLKTLGLALGTNRTGIKIAGIIMS